MSLVTERPVVAKIADELFARLETLAEVPASIVPFRDVIRPAKLATYMPEHGLVVLIRGDQTRVPELDCPGNPPAVAYRQLFHIVIHLAPSEKDSTPLDQYEDYAHAEVVKAVRVNGTWHTFDDNAIDATFEPAQSVSGEGGYDGIVIPLSVVYRVAEDDPYTVRP